MLRLSLIITLLFASPVRAEFIDGNTLHERCSGDDIYKLYCMGYSAAVTDVMEKNTIYGWSACVSKNVTAAQVADFVTSWLDSHPEKRHYTAPSLVAQALAEAFPC